VWDGDNESPKIWLVPDKSGDETATWEVCVTYMGYDDHAHNVSGTITITNTGTADAVIESVVDLLCGEEIDIVWPDGTTFPYTLEPGQSLVGTYSEDGFCDEFNVVTVTTEVDEYSSDEMPVAWDDPDVEHDNVVSIVDNSEFLADTNLGTLDAATLDEDEEVCFDYANFFAWEDYSTAGPHFYDNTAEIVETGQTAEAGLVVNWLDEELTVTKTVETYFERTHEWDIDKTVETQFGHTIGEDEDPKIWLYTDGSGDETATWYVDVTYEGSEDSGYNISGIITITNTGGVAANITEVVDELCGTPIEVHWVDEDDEPVYFPYILEVGETLEGTYSVDYYCEGFNIVTVTTERAVYTSEEVDVAWGDPDVEINKTVTIVDDSELFGEVELGTVTEPNDAQFTYEYDFAYEDYDECGAFTFDNTATIVETGQYAEATLKVNVQCVEYETAYAKGEDAICFIPTFSNWGWTNPVSWNSTVEMDLWAAAGQCDTDNGTLVGTVTVVYDEDGYVTVEYNLFAGYTLEETHVYAGTTMFPQVRRGRSTVDTVAPGQYYNAGPFEYDEDAEEWPLVYVIAHAVVGIPDPYFGP